MPPGFGFNRRARTKDFIMDHMTLKQTLIGIFSIVVTLIVLYVADELFQSKQSLFTRYAEEVIADCADAPYKPSCYDEKIPKLMDRGLTMEEAFQVTALIQERDRDYFYCHVLGHNLSAKEAAKDLSKWTEVIARAPSGICSNGAIHGAFQERFRDEVLTGDELERVLPDIAVICEDSDQKDFTGLEQASCHHAIGHLLMYMTDADIHESTNACDRISEIIGKDYTQMCYEGSYMQIFQPLEPEDFALVENIAPVDSKAAERFCETFTNERRAACHRESWPQYRAAIMEDASALHSFCSLVPGEDSIRRCYNGMFYILAAQFNFDSQKIITLCNSVPDQYMGQCFANSASRFIETDYRLIDRAVALCDTAQVYGVGDRCYKELLFYSAFAFHEDSDAFVHLCEKLPEPWQTSCFNGDGSSVILNED